MSPPQGIDAAIIRRTVNRNRGRLMRRASAGRNDGAFHNSPAALSASAGRSGMASIPPVEHDFPHPLGTPMADLPQLDAGQASAHPPPAPLGRLGGREALVPAEVPELPLQLRGLVPARRST